MKTIQSLFTISLTSILLASCVVSDYPGSQVSPASASVSFGVYDSLPDSYVGDSYYYQNKHYYGGNYQRGTYSYQGRQYTDRYYQGGKYYYGGRHENHNNPHSRRSTDQRHLSNHQDQSQGDKHDRH